MTENTDALELCQQLIRCQSVTPDDAGCQSIIKQQLDGLGFEFIGKIFTKIISFTQDGTIFLFRSFETGVIESPLANFAIMILPTVIFFSALTSLFYYWGVLRFI